MSIQAAQERIDVAKSVHDESIIVDNNHYGPWIYSDKMMQTADRLLAANTYPPAVWDEMIRVRIHELVSNAEYLREYLANWDKAGVTAICYSLFSYAEPYSFATTVREIAHLTYLFDNLPDKFQKILKAEDLVRVKAKKGHGIILYVESTDEFGKNLDNIDFFHELGLRIVQLTYNTRNWVGNGCTERVDDGLSYFGLQVVERLNELHMIVDLSHCGYKTTMDAIANSKDPVVFTHTFAKEVSKHDRGKTDEQLQALSERGGFVGVMLVPHFITSDPHPSLEHFFRHIDYIVKLIGVDHLAIGTDLYPPANLGLSKALDSSNSWMSLGFRPEHRAGESRKTVIESFKDWSDWPNITAGLLSRGYSKDDVNKILGGNFLRVFERIVG